MLYIALLIWLAGALLSAMVSGLILLVSPSADHRALVKRELVHSAIFWPWITLTGFGNLFLRVALRLLMLWLPHLLTDGAKVRLLGVRPTDIFVVSFQQSRDASDIEAARTRLEQYFKRWGIRVPIIFLSKSSSITDIGSVPRAKLIELLNG